MINRNFVVDMTKRACELGSVGCNERGVDTNPSNFKDISTGKIPRTCPESAERSDGHVGTYLIFVGGETGSENQARSCDKVRDEDDLIRSTSIQVVKAWEKSGTHIGEPVRIPADTE